MIIHVSYNSSSSGSFESMLTGQRLLAEAQATSAELHAFAATHKRPPEIQDACTNTDPGKTLGQAYNILENYDDFLISVLFSLTSQHH